MSPDRQPALYRALLPLRFFVGFTFLFAGLDKLVDPAFLQASGPGSIGEQLATYARVSPLAPLIAAVALPNPILIGVVVASLEILAGLGALTGLAYRPSAVIGAGLSATFFLTASWTIRPYYLGADLPYLLAWVTLGLAGHGGLYVAGPGIERAFDLAPPPGSEEPPVDPARRGLLQFVVLGATALTVAGMGALLSAMNASSGSAVAEPSTGPLGEASGGPSGGPSSGPSASRVPGEITTVAAVRAHRATPFTDPATGDPAVLVALSNGMIVGFDAICNHAGCTVAFDQLSGHLLCPCHGAIFDPAHGGAVLDGPTDQPLASLPIRIDQQTGVISLAG